MAFSNQELTHYNRHFTLSNVGERGQLLLKNARVLCIGAGGLGSPALLYLAAAGVGTIGIVDDDVIEASNLQRQIIYSYQDIGKNKSVVAKEHLLELNPNINIVAYPIRISSANILEIINNYDFIIDGTDNFQSHYLINDACYQLKKPNVYASVTEFEGQCSVFSYPGPCYRCLFETPPDINIPTCNEAGVLGVLPGILGSLQASEVLKLIIGIGQPLIGRLLKINVLRMSFNEYSFTKNPNCVCTINEVNMAQFDLEEFSPEITVTELRDLQDKKKDFILLDVRELNEYETRNLQGKLIPLGDLTARMNELDPNKYIVIHCAVGGRSWHAMQFLKANGFKKVSNLTGGIVAWVAKFGAA